MNENLVWVDLEMTGLDINVDKIIEMACIVTDKNLNIIGKGPDIVIHQDKEIMDQMNEWCAKHHGESGLTDSVLKSNISLESCEAQMLSFIEKHTIKGRSCLAGNSVHGDKEFLSKYMPRFMSHLHYRIVDVSTIKELARRWYPTEFANSPKKQLTHRALDDIQESIDELKYYRAHVFK